MAVLNLQQAAVTGTALTFSAAAGGGDSFLPGDRTILLVRNSDASSKTVTVVVPGTKYGQALPDITLSVAAGATAAFGPFPPDLAGTAGYVDVLYSAVTSVTVALVGV